MRIVSHGRHRGAVLVFVLMALIALLAIAVVLLSRLRHREAAEPHPDGISVTGSTPSYSDDLVTTESQPGTSVSLPAASPAFPPPPPPSSTPENRNLPPEG